MVQATELRLNNWIIFKEMGKGRGKYAQIKGGDIARLVSGDSYNEYHPIPLSPEVLQKCGLQDFQHSSDFYFVDGEVGSFRFDTRYGGKYYGNEIKYLHQLQNVFFALTGTELNYQP